jgi:T5SS/PEP-CTERM-associated repeat protein/autotransporter passenger strand-loop-strand repeat protein
MTFYNVTSGQSISGITISSGSFAFISSGGLAISCVVKAQAGMTVFSGGVASFNVLSGGFEYVSSGGVVSDTVLSGGTEAVYGGGSANSSVVSADGSEVIYSGGKVVGAVLGGGQQAVYAGGTASETVVSSGAAEYLYSGGTAGGTVVRDGGDAFVFPGGVASDTVVSGGGTITINSGANSDFLVVSRGGSIDLPDLVYSNSGSATVDGTELLTVVEGASSATVQLAGNYTGESFLPAAEPNGGGGTVLILIEPPRTLLWSGAQNTGFATATNWNDLTNGLTSAVAPPNATDTVEFLTGGCAITGTGTAVALAFGGSASWQITSAASLSALTGVTVGQGGAGTLLIDNGAGITGLGSFDEISGAAGGVASVTVDGAGATWKSTGELIVGALGPGALTVGNAASLGAAATGVLPAMALGANGGGNGALLVTGAGSTATLVGQLDVGEAGGGTLTVGNQGTLRTGNDAALDPSEGFDIAHLAGASGQATVTGANSLLSNIGRFVVGDAGLGRLDITAGATVITVPGIGSNLRGAVIANAASARGSSVEVSGAGSTWQITGVLDVGVAGSGALLLGNGATVTADSLDVGDIASAVGQISLSGVGTRLIVANAATVADDGTGVLSVLNGATFSAASLTIGNTGNSSGAVIVSGAGSVINLTGALNVGTALGTGDITIGPGAAVHASVLSFQGQMVLEGGLADPTVQLIDQGQTAGGFGTIAAGFVVDEGVIQSKSAQRLLMLRGTVLGGGTLTINGTVQGSNPAGILQISAGGTMELTGAVLNVATTTFTDDLTPAGTYTVNNSVVDVSFADAAGVLLLDDIAGFAGTISADQGGDRFVITGGTLSGLGVTNGHTLTVSDSGAGAGAGGTDRIIFSSAVTAAGFGIVNGNTVQVACFAEGTRIETDAGCVAVEDLRVGDEVRTLLGGPGRIAWVGSRIMDCSRHPRPETVWPVRIATGAFAENMPSRDLFVSPDHAIYVDGVLIPAKLLLNGTTVRQVRRRHVVYHHIELARHDVVLAEGLPAETYLDTGDRAKFHGGSVTVLHPDFTARTWEMEGCAELVVTGLRLSIVRERLAARAYEMERRRSARPSGQRRGKS